MHLNRGVILTAASLFLIGSTAAASEESIEDVAAAIANPFNLRFRRYLSASAAIKLTNQLPLIYCKENCTRDQDDDDDEDSGRLPLLRQYERPGNERRDLCTDNGLVTPDCIRQYYNIMAFTPQANRVTFAVYATEAASYNPSDTAAFLKQYRPQAQGAGYEIIGSGDASEAANVESQFEVALDTQTLLGTAWPAKGLLYNLGGVFGPNPGQPYRPFVNFLTGLVSNESIPSVVSFSESIPEDMMDPDYARSLCTLMALVGARGVSLLFSSGDNGANGDSPDGVHKQVFETEFPASCPWVIAVGGTSNIAHETAATGSTIPALDSTFYTASGGGFSQLFEAPSWQKDIVDRYMEQYVPSSYANVSGFNARGRGVPDVSAFSTNMPVVVNGASLPLGGTSASTPLWAAIVALLNDYEASQGRRPIGFFNPWLYSLQANGSSAVLRDIVTGGNNKGGCNVLSGCNLTETLGYDVTPGWDPVTGLGSPIFTRLVQALDGTAHNCS